MESVEESLSSLKEKSMNRDKEHRVVYMDSRNELGAWVTNLWDQWVERAKRVSAL